MIYGQGGTTTGYNTHYTGTDGYFSMLLASTRPTNKLLALQKDVFDINKVTVVGSPTITSDGVASGFSSVNYVKVPIVLTSPFTLNYKFNSGNSNEVTVAKWALNFVGEHCTIYCNANSSTITVEYDANDGTHKYSAFGQLNPNTDYEWLFTINGSKTTMVVKNLSLGTEYTYTLPLFKEDFSATEVTLRNFISGSIDLKQFKIYVDNQLVFQPVKPTYLIERRKDGYDPSKFTVVGNPTITNDGLVSGFGATSYIQKTLETPLTQDDNFKISLSFTTSNVGTQQQIVSFGGNYLTRPRLQIRADATLIFVYLTSSGTEKITSLGSITQNTRYNLEIISRNGNLQILVNGIEKLNTNDFSCNITGLYSLYANNWFKGSIDLKQFSITVDGEEIFTGAKVGHYMLRR